MKFLSSTAVALVMAAVGVNGHATFQYINDQQGPIRLPPNNNPITNYGSADMACNINGGRAAAQVLSVSAGSSVTLEWHHEGRNSQAIDPSHKGPVSAYLAKVADATTATNPSSLGWFKIYHDGLNGGTWGVDKLIANGGKYSVRIPSSIAAGDYLLRSEIIALHAASGQNGAQVYTGCAQIRVTGGGNASPATVRFPGAYDANHPGVKVNIYSGLTNYQIPGPAVFSS